MSLILNNKPCYCPNKGDQYEGDGGLVAEFVLDDSEQSAATNAAKAEGNEGVNHSFDFLVFGFEAPDWVGVDGGHPEIDEEANLG